MGRVAATKRKDGERNMEIKSLLKSTPNKGTDRRVWSIPLGGVWLPFFTATNTVGDTAIPAEVLGAPLRLQYNKDGTPKFSQSGRPVIRVVRELSEQIRIVRENFTAGLIAYATQVAQAMPDAYKAQVVAIQGAGHPIREKDAATLADYLEKAQAAAAEELEKRAAAEKTPEKEREMVAA